MQISKSFLLFIVLFLLSFSPVGNAFAAPNVRPVNVTVISATDWRNTGYYSVADALRGLTSFNVEQQGFRLTNAQLKLRGTSNSARVVVLLDDRPLTHDNDAQVDLGQIPLSMLDRIEIIEGGAPSAYSGEAIAGTVHLITQRPKNKGMDTTLGTTIARFGTKSALGQFLGRSFWGDISYLASKQDSGGYMHNEQTEASNHFINWSRSFNGKGYWGLEYMYHQAEVALPYGTAVPFEQWDRRAEQVPVDQTAVRQELRQHVKGILSVPTSERGTVNFNWTEVLQDSDEKQTRDDISQRDEDSRSSFGSLSYDENNLHIGGSYKRDREKIAPAEGNHISQESAYVSRIWPGSRWTFAPSVRWDHHSESGNFFSPRFSIINTPGDNWTLSSSITRSFRAPRFEELYIASRTVPNSNLDEEKAWSADVGAEYRISRRAYIKALGFLTKVKDVIQLEPTANQWNNFGHEKNYGLETSAAVPLGRKLTLSGSWTYQRSFIDSEDGLGYQQTAMTPLHIALGKLALSVSKNSDFINEVRYKSKQYSNNGNSGAFLPGFYVWNARFELRILKAALFCSVENILNRRYAEAVSYPSAVSGVAGPVLYPQADRTYWAGASIRFLN